MISFDSIKKVHLEISTYCQAECPFCPRNLFGYPYNGGYPVEHMSLENFKKVFNVEFVQQLEKVLLCGNLGDPAMNPETPDIVDYLYSVNPNINIRMSTNGSIQNTNFWKRLKNVEVIFCLDGLEDTHSIYRRKTNYNKILENAKAHIEAGGVAIWQMIAFEHNKHQIEQCKKLSEQLGFFQFKEVSVESRLDGPVYDKDGNLERVIGNWQLSTDLDFWKNIADNPHGFYEEDIILKDIDYISCESVNDKSIYITANFEVYPCCYMGFYPTTYTDAHFYQGVNRVIKEYVKENNAIDFGLEHSMKWFDAIRPEFEANELTVCRFSCGKCK